jgi:tetratricopeptide (TPR) repeat protein
MLESADRAMFSCMSVFVGGASLAAIERVCTEEVDGDPIDAVTSLVEQSLVRQEEGVDGEPRFSMLETIRDFAMDQAVAEGSWDRLRDRHAHLFRELAEESAGEIMGSRKRSWLDRLEEEHDNLRAALVWASEVGAAEVALRTSASLWRFWQMRGYLAEGLERVTQALAIPHAADHPRQRADALSAAAGLAYWQADAARSRALYEEEIEVRRELGDRLGLAEALYGVSFTWAIIDLQSPSAITSARSHITEALAIYEELDDAPGIGRCEWALANVAWGAREIDQARVHGLRAYDVFNSLDDRFNLGWATYTLGLGALAEIYRDGPLPAYVEEVRARLNEALRIFAEAQDVTGYALVLDAYAALAFQVGDLQRSARLSGAVDVLERSTGTGLNRWNRDVVGFDPEPLRNDPQQAWAWAAGEALTAEEAVAYALEG